MKENYFTFGEPKKVKKPTKVKAPYWEIDVNSWSWMHFLNFWDDLLKDVGVVPPRRTAANMKKWKGMVTSSMELRGNEQFKAMMEYFLSHTDEFSQLSVQLNIVCGSHYWAEAISQKIVQKQKNVEVEDKMFRRKA